MRGRKTGTSKPSAGDKKTGGGTAIGGGVNFQAIVTAIIAVKILRGAPLGWLDGVAKDLPIAVWAESEGPGDDIRVEFEGGRAMEIQAKKGLHRGPALWASLEAMAAAIVEGRIDFGILAVAPDSSGTVRDDLAVDLERIGQGRCDLLTDIGKEFEKRLAKLGISAERACGYLRIRVVHGLASDDVEVKAAKEALRYVCLSEEQADSAWDALYRQAILLIEQRGRWTLRELLRLLASVVDVRNGDMPISVLDRWTKWTLATNGTFQITGTRRPIPLKNLLPMRLVPVPFETNEANDASAALARYHQWTKPEHDQGIFDARWTARFKKSAVVMAGPGLGKSTMMKELAHQYAQDTYPVLKVSLKSIAAGMKDGIPFSDSLVSHALSGSGISRKQFEHADLNNCVVLADGLDECGAEHHAVAEAIKCFALGHPAARIVVTTRPIGYNTAELNKWPHYRLIAPKKDDGAANLGVLVEAAAENAHLQSDGKEIARRELQSTPAADAIAISPQLLGMAASLIVRDGVLPRTRPQLFERLIRLFEELPSASSTSRQSPTIAKRVLDVIGWTLLQNPLVTVEQLVEACGVKMSSELGLPQLTATATVETALSHWERVGLVERVHHAGSSLLTFIHKTFAEFVAARFLIAMPDSARRTVLERLVDLPEWTEVIGFAGGLGAGDAIAKLYLERRASGYRGQLERALILAGDKDAEVSDGLTKALVELAFKGVESTNDEDRFSLGVALADLASKRPDVVVPSATARLEATDPGVKLVAWATTVESGSAQIDANAIAEAMKKLLPHISAGLAGSLLGGLNVGVGQDRDLIERIAIAALKAQPDDQLKSFAEAELSNPKLGTTGFQSKVRSVFRARGILNDEQLNRAQSRSVALFDLLAPPKEWMQASRSAIYALAKAVATNPRSASTRGPPQFLQFSGLISITQFNNVVASDVHAWTQSYDEQAIRSTLGTLVQISVLDAKALAEEASEILQRIDADPALDPFHLPLPDVDVPEPEWSRVVNLAVDREALKKAMLHSSDWMVYVATNLLEKLPVDRGELVTLLNEATETSLTAAARLVRTHDPDNAVMLLMDRLERDLSKDVSAIYDELRDASAEPSPRLIAIATRGIVLSNTRTAKAAVALLADLVDRGAAIDSEAISKAEEYWHKHEPESKGNGVVPDSPRSDLLGLRIKLGGTDVGTMLSLLNDKRSDVRRVSEGWLLDRMATSPGVTGKVLDCIVQQQMPPAVAASILRSPIVISATDLNRIEALLAAPDPKWRRAAMTILNPKMIAPDRLAEHARRLAADSETEIRTVARKLLANMHGYAG